MSEATAEVNETTENAEEVTPTINLEDLTVLERALVEELSKDIETYNTNVAARNAKFGDFQTAKETIYESDEPSMVKARSLLEELKSKIEDLESKRMQRAREIFEASRSGNAEEETALNTAIEEARKRIKSGRDFLSGQNADALTLLPKMSGARSGSGTGKGEGGRKIRGMEVYVNGELATTKKTTGPDKGKTVSSFSAAAMKIGVPTSNLQAEYFKAVGTDNKEQFPATAEFTYTHDGKDYKITANRLAE